MAKSLSEFKKINGLDGIYTAENGNLRCNAIKLESGGLCLFSPVMGLGEEAIASLAKLGKVEFLVAPNHYHNKGLMEYCEAFPKASLCASPEAHKRLEKITGLQFFDLNALVSILPHNIQLVFPRGLKTGEVWINATSDQSRAWLVVDAFSGPKGNPGNIAREPEMLGTFPKFGVGDKEIYLTWVERQIQEAKPTMIVPCHGNIVCSSQLAKSLQLLIQNKL